ncbi:MAG: hypothetical protein R3A44_27055 [Caldilineaceae bacterium]
MRRFVKPITVLLVTVLLLQPFCTLAMIDQIFGRNTRVARAQTNDGAIYLPIVIGGTGTGNPPGDAPTFVINSPVAGSSVGGTTYFSIQPTNGDTINSVTFRVGSAVLGSDNDGSNGFRVFLDAREFAAGPTELSATASGPNGQTTERINVTLVPNPPQSATVGSDGAVLASEIGSVVSLLPGSAPVGTTVTIDELTQAETTAQHGIDWESMGVTFLGAQDVQSSEPISGPFGMVSSAGFGTRVQPGQAVVNYRIAPDVDGDGADEIVVVNTASVAPNGDVVADSILQPTILQDNPQETQQEATIIAAPGELVTFPVSGFNPYATNSNSALFDINGVEYKVAGSVYRDPNNDGQQIFRVAIPELSSPTAKLQFINELSQQATASINVTLQPLPALGRSADEVFSEFFDTYSTLIDQKIANQLQNASDQKIAAQVERNGNELVNQLADVKNTWIDLYTKLDTTVVAEPEVQVHIDEALTYVENVAKQIEQYNIQSLARIAANMNVETNSCNEPFIPDDPIDNVQDFIKNLITPPYIGTGWANLATAALITAAVTAAAIGASAATITTLTVLAGAASAVVVANAAADLISDLFDNANNALDYANRQNTGDCDEPPPAPCPPSQSGPSGPTGMGAAPPPGGPGCGGSGGSGGGSQLTAASFQQASPVMVKIFSNGRATPFTGMTDAGGYFFVPFIPADEPFTALAIDTATGETRSFSGTGPQTGESVFMFFDFFHEETFLPSIQWDGGGDGTSWTDPQNWDTDQVPAASDRVLIDVAGEPTITYDKGSTTIISLVSAETMEFSGGSLTVNAKSTISSALTMNGGFTLIADGLGAALTATGATIMAGAKLTARNGGHINLPGLTRFDGDGGDFFTTLRADGAGSRLDLSAVTQFGGNTFVNDATKIEALNGGQIDLSAVTAITTGKAQFTADGANSAIDLGALTRFTRGGKGGSLLKAVNDGNINIAQLTELRGVNMVLDGTGTLATGQITIFTGGKAEVSGVTPDFGAMSDVDGSSFIVKAGGKVALPNVTTYAGDGEGSDFFTALEADGPGSVLDLSTLTVLEGNTFVNDYLKVSATAGGKIELGNVRKIEVGKVLFTADGSGSTIELSSLTRFARGGKGSSYLKPLLNGAILADQLTELQGIGLILDGTGSLATSQITTFTGGKAEVTATTPDFGNMTNVDGSSFIVKAGGQVALPKVTSYAGDGAGSDFFTALSADGAGSLLDLSTVTTFAGNTFVNDNLGVKALNGGKIDLQAVNEITVGMVQFSAEDSGSLIDLSALTNFSRTNRGESFLSASQNGQIDLKNNTVALQNVNLVVNENGNYTVGAFQLDGDSNFSGSGTIPGNIVNRASVAPGDSPGQLQIGGNYQQEITGTLAIELNGLSAGAEFDQLQIAGNATLGGTLDLTLLNNYMPAIGDAFVIVTAAGVTGEFTTINGADIDSSRTFSITYGVDSVTIDVVGTGQNH